MRTSEPNDPRFPELWGLLNIGQTINGVAGTPGADIRAVAAWDRALGSRNTVVGVVDTGIDYTHPDLAGERLVGAGKLQRHDRRADDHLRRRHARLQRDQQVVRSLRRSLPRHACRGHDRRGRQQRRRRRRHQLVRQHDGPQVPERQRIGNARQRHQRHRIRHPGEGRVSRRAARTSACSRTAGAAADSRRRCSTRSTERTRTTCCSWPRPETAPATTTPCPPIRRAMPRRTSSPWRPPTTRTRSPASRTTAPTSVHLGAPGRPGVVDAARRRLRVLQRHIDGDAARVRRGRAAALALHGRHRRGQVDAAEQRRSDSGAVGGITITGGRLNVGRAIDACGPAGNTSPIVTLTEPSGDTIYSRRRRSTLARHGIRWAGRRRAGGVLRRHGAHRHRYGAAIRAHVDQCRGRQLCHSPPSRPTTMARPARRPRSTIHVLPTGSLPFGGRHRPIPGHRRSGELQRRRRRRGLSRSRPPAIPADSTARPTSTSCRRRDAGGGYSLGYVSSGEWLAYRCRRPATADYTLDARVASAGPGGAFHVEVDGIDVTGAMVVPNTGGWQTWQTIAAPGIPLTAGPHLVRVVVDSNGHDRLLGQPELPALDDPGINAPPSVQLTSPANGASYYGAGDRSRSAPPPAMWTAASRRLRSTRGRRSSAPTRRRRSRSRGTTCRRATTA